jgi:hypothetical protein
VGRKVASLAEFGEGKWAMASIEEIGADTLPVVMENLM